MTGDKADELPWEKISIQDNTEHRIAGLGWISEGDVEGGIKHGRFVPEDQARELLEMKLKIMSGILHLAADEELKALKEENTRLKQAVEMLQDGLGRFEFLRLGDDRHVATDALKQAQAILNGKEGGE